MLFLGSPADRIFLYLFFQTIPLIVSSILPIAISSIAFLVPSSVKKARKDNKTGKVFGIVELHLHPDTKRREILEALIPPEYREELRLCRFSGIVHINQ